MNVKRLFSLLADDDSNEDFNNYLCLITAEQHMKWPQDGLNDHELKNLSERIISIYDYKAFHKKTKLHEIALEVIVRLARKHDIAFDCIKENADNYARLMSYEDSDYYSPNSLEALARIGSEKSQELLETYIKSNSIISHYLKDPQ